jgi:small subunit ribosomal protein S1
MSENSHEQENFADLFNENGLTQKQLSPGEKIKAAVVDITQDSIFLDVGEKSEGFVERGELEDDEGNVTVNVGDTIEVYFLSSERNEMLFTTRIGGGSTSRAHLEQAYKSGVPLEGFIKKEIKGGFEVTVAGSIRTFCPYSQMEIKRILILEEEREEKRLQLMDSLQEGMTVKGTITSIRDFGAFVDINGIEGLIPISEIGWGQVSSIHDVLSEDQEVEIVVMKLDWDNDRFSFSLKQALPDPWDDIVLKFPVGTEQTGTVVRLTKFGAFVNLATGIDGLVHISKLGGGRRINHPREVVEEGQIVTVKIEDIDTEKKRVSLALVSDETADESVEGSDTEDYKKYVNESASSASQKSSVGTLGELLQEKLKEKEKKH